MREEVRKQCCVILAILVLFSLVCFTLFMSEEGEEKDGELPILKYFAVSSIVTTVCFTTVLFLSKHNLKFAELLGPSVLLPQLIGLMYTYYFLGFETTATSRNFIQRGELFVILIVANFMAVDYLPHLVVREICGLAFAVMTILYRHSYDENEIESALAMQVLLFFGLETIIYVNHKAKANLFMRIKVIATQEE